MALRRTSGTSRRPAAARGFTGRDDLRLVGSRCGPFDAALRLLDEQRVEVESLIDARYPLTSGVEAFAHSRRPGVVKVLLEISEND